jgi:hypothetical protein
MKFLLTKVVILRINTHESNKRFICISRCLKPITNPFLGKDPCPMYIKEEPNNFDKTKDQTDNGNRDKIFTWTDWLQKLKKKQAGRWAKGKTREQYKGSNISKLYLGEIYFEKEEADHENIILELGGGKQMIK